MAVDGSGNVYVAGQTTGVADLGSGNVSNSGPSAFVTSFTAAGTHRWHKVMSSNGANSSQGVAVDSSGNVYLSGAFQGTANLGGGAVAAKGISGVFVTSFTASGGHRWQKSLGGAGVDYGRGLAVDSAGRVFITGTVSGPADLGGGNLLTSGASGAFLTSFTAGGVHRWQTAFEAATGHDVAVDGKGNVYCTGGFSGPTDFGGGQVKSKSLSDIFVTSFSAAGKYSWHRALGGVDGDNGEGVAGDSGGNLYLTGYFSNSVDLGGGTVSSKGLSDIFIVKRGP